MELELQDDQELFVETTRRFLEAESPLTHVRALYEDAVGFDRDYWRQRPRCSRGTAGRVPHARRSRFWSPVASAFTRTSG